MEASFPGDLKHKFTTIMRHAIDAVKIMIGNKNMPDKEVIDTYQPIIAALIQARIITLEESIDDLYDIVKSLDAHLADISSSKGEP